MTDDNEALAARLRELESKLDEKSTAALTEIKKEKSDRPVGLIVTGLIALILALIAIGFFAFGGGDDDTVAESALSPAEISALQLNCVNNDPPRYWDELGNCYSQEPKGLSDAERLAFLVAPGVVPTTVPAGGGDSQAAPAAPVAPQAPVNNGAAPAAPAAPTTAAAAPAAPAAPTTASAAPTTAAPPAAPTTAPNAPAAPTTAATGNTTAPTTAATTPLLTFGSATSQWKVALAPPPPVGYDNVQQCADEDPRSSVCNSYFDLAKSVTIAFGVNNGVADGNARNSNLERDIEIDGEMKTGQTTRIIAKLANNSGVQSEYFFDGTPGPGCTFSGSYSYLFRAKASNSGDVGPRTPPNADSVFPSRGNFSMTYEGNDCPN